MPRDYIVIYVTTGHDLGQGLLLLIGFAGSLVGTLVRPVKARRCYYLGICTCIYLAICGSKLRHYHCCDYSVQPGTLSGCENLVDLCYTCCY